MGESVKKVGSLMDTVVRDNWPSGCEGPSSVADISTFAEKETELLDCRNPTLVFEYEKSRDSVETNFRCFNKRKYFRSKKTITSGSPKCSDDIKTK